MNYFDKLYDLGQERVKNRTIVVFGMVRDCGASLKKNIKTIESIANHFYDYRVAILENNSRDDTKQVLNDWKNSNNKVYISLNDFDERKYKEIKSDDQYYKYFQLSKLQKYYDYRNLMMDFLESIPFNADYSMLVDLDVERIDVKGVLTSFGSDIEWDAVTANGYSYSTNFKRRYHDTFALCEYGLETQKQTLQMVRDYREVFSFLKKNMPFIRVYSSYGGIAIYKSKAIKGLRYAPVFNEYGGVQVRCEHFSLFKAMAERGYNKVFINPNMEVFYQKVTLGLIIKKIKETIFKM